MQLEIFRPASELESAEFSSLAAGQMAADAMVREETQTLRILVAAGGTGGHIFPALAVAEELLQRGAVAPQFQFLGTARGLESRLIEAAGFPYRALAAAGLKGIRGRRLIGNALLLPRTFAEAGSALAQFRLDGFGTVARRPRSTY